MRNNLLETAAVMLFALTVVFIIAIVLNAVGGLS